MAIRKKREDLGLWQCFILFSYLCYFRRGLSCFVIKDGGRKKKCLKNRKKPWRFWSTETQAVERKDATWYWPRVCWRFSVFSVHKSIRLWSTFYQAVCSWIVTSAMILISLSAEKKMQKWSSGEIDMFYSYSMWEIWAALEKGQKSIIIWRNNTWAIWRYEWLKSVLKVKHVRRKIYKDLNICN